MSPREKLEQLAKQKEQAKIDPQQQLSQDLQKNKDLLTECQQFIGFQLPTGQKVRVREDDKLRGSSQQDDGVKYIWFAVNHVGVDHWGPIPLFQVRCRNNKYEYWAGRNEKKDFDYLDDLVQHIVATLAELDEKAYSEKLLQYQRLRPRYLW